jgi:hypothetical protein
MSRTVSLSTCVVAPVLETFVVVEPLAPASEALLASAVGAYDDCW